MNRIQNYIKSYTVTYNSLLDLENTYQNTTGKKILVFTHAMNEGGAPLVLWEALKLIAEKKYSIFVISLSDGKLCHRNEKNIYTFVAKRPFFSIKRKLLKYKWDSIIINTSIMYKWVNVFTNVKTSWWIHEGDTYISKLKKYLPKNLNSNTSVFCVSEWTKECLERYGFHYNTSVLYYGIEDNMNKINNGNESDTLTFLFIGALCNRKNQLFFLKAVENMKPSLRNKCKFIIIGDRIKGYEMYAEQVLEKINSMNCNIKYITRVNHNEMSQVYAESDVLVSCSIDDPLPVVVTEAFMNSKCTIISSNSGQSRIVSNNIDAFVYKAEDIKQLINLLEYVTELDKKEIKKIGYNGRKLYEKYFSTDVFEKRVFDLINK